MVFSSETFLFLFLPIFLAAYYLTPPKWRNLTLLLESYLFYGWWRFDFLMLLCANTLWAYVFSILVEKYQGTPKAQLFVAIGVTGHLLVLGVFKYLNFFIDSFASLWGTTPDALGIHWQLLLPIGISFYVFHSISYLVDVYRGDAKVSRNIIDFAAFLALFPQLVAGPILRYKDLAPQFEHREHSWELFNAGWQRFLIGLSMKVLIADPVAPLADAMFSAPNPTVVESWLGALAYSMQLYFDFAGYSAMAIGLALINTIATQRDAAHVLHLQEQVNWARPGATRFIDNLTHAMTASKGVEAHIAALARVSALVHREALVLSYNDVLLLMAGLFFLAVPLTLLLAKPKAVVTDAH